MAKLRPRARIIRTIGDKLISGPEAALIELVKNSYDADSGTVFIKIIPPARIHEDKNDETDGTGLIIVHDYGHGMTRDDILSIWLEPATDDKARRQFSPGERRMLGAKGIGRFASARLGESLEMLSKCKLNNRQIEISKINIEWSIFESHRYLEDIDIDIESTLEKFDEHALGTRIEIRNLKDPWNRTQLERLIRELRRLVSPISATESGFSIYLDLTDITVERFGFDGQSLVSGFEIGSSPDAEKSNDPFERCKIKPFAMQDHCDYRLVGELKDDGTFDGYFAIERGDKKKETIRVPGPALGEDESPCGPVSLNLNIYDREREAVEALFKRMGVDDVQILQARRILDDNAGIAIFRQGFRIRPYGDPEMDWLEMDGRRVQDPSKRLGHNQISGAVTILDEDESNLIERSSREGLERNGAYFRLVRLIQDVLAHVEQRRFDFRQKAGASRKPPGDFEAIRNKLDLREIKKVTEDLPLKTRVALKKAIDKDVKQVSIALEGIQQYQQVLESRAALGLVVAEVLHEGRRHVGSISTKSKSIVDGAERVLEISKFGDVYRNQFPDNAKGIYRSAGDLSRLFRMLDPISGRRRGRPKDFAALSIVERCLELLKDAIGRAEITVKILGDIENSLVHGYEDDLQAALLNILDNAIYWLSVSTNLPRTLTIVFSTQRKNISLSIANNGPLIDEDYYDRLFEAGFTLKSEGTGLGLAISREALRRSNGELEFVKNSDETTFKIVLLKASA